MDDSRKTMIGAVAGKLAEELTLGGQRDFSAPRLSQMETEVYEVADELSQLLMQALLERQAQQVQQEDCPSCGSRLEVKDSQAKLLQLGRGKVHWRQPVRRCLGCRRDFFPSGPSDGL